jgi:hypothetical protein
MNRYRTLLGTVLLAAALLVPVQLFACAPLISCGPGDPCTGELTSGFTVDLSAFSFFFGTFTSYDPSGPCFELCNYTMTYASGDSGTMTTLDWGCDGSATGIIS